MSWLRVDDRFADHPKIGALTDREFRIWVRTLCYCARYRDPTVDDATLAAVKGLDRKRVERFFELDLLDREADSFVIHDWHEYAPKDPTGADRQAKWRATRNGRVTDKVTDDAVTNAVTEPSLARAGARASPSRPVPEEQNPVTPTALEGPPNGSGHGEEELDRVNRLLADAALQDMPQ